MVFVLQFGRTGVGRKRTPVPKSWLIDDKSFLPNRRSNELRAAFCRTLFPAKATIHRISQRDHACSTIDYRYSDPLSRSRLLAPELIRYFEVRLTKIVYDREWDMPMSESGGNICAKPFHLMDINLCSCWDGRWILIGTQSHDGQN